MKKNKKLIALLAPLLILFMFTAVYTVVSTSGKTVYLKTEAYDPYDLFRGDYVQLNYEMQEIDLNLFDEDLYTKKYNKEYEYYEYEAAQRHVYISYDDSSGYAVPIKVSKNKPEHDSYIGAELNYINSDRWAEEDNDEVTASLDFGLERFYVQEGTGLALEDLSRDGELVVEVRSMGNIMLIKDVFPIKDLRTKQRLI